MKIIFLGCDSDRLLWKKIAEEMEFKSVFVSSNELKLHNSRSLAEVFRNELPDLCLACCGHRDGQDNPLFSDIGQVPFIPVGAEALMEGWASVSMELAETVNRYLVYGGEENFRNAILYLYRSVLKIEIKEPKPPLKNAFEGIYDTENLELYEDPAAFMKHTGTYGCYVGILSHRGNYIRQELEVERALTRALNARGVGAIPVFYQGLADKTLGNLGFEEVIEKFFMNQGNLVIQGLINLSIFGIQARDGLSVFEQAAKIYKTMGIPVFHPVESFMCTLEQWEKQRNPLASELSYTYLSPEMQGMVEPVFIGYKDEQGYPQAIQERVEHFAGRVSRYMRLGSKGNGGKKAAIVLHNSVCSGVEATIGQAFGMDAFESVAEILKRLKSEGWFIDPMPENGEMLFRWIMERKAYSDFRWTSVEDIVKSGGCLYRMPIQEYLGFYNELPPENCKYMEETWGKPPGEGMVLDGSLIVTGLDLGNVCVMVQPKRGCHKAKCTGEICKILHDPVCPPPHQYLASYRYIQECFHADACIHVGTDGSLEYLPGKVTGMSGKCWPDIVLGELPNFYLYHTGVPSEGILAKRRCYANIIDYFPVPYTGVSDTFAKLYMDIGAYLQARNQENGQEKLWKTTILEQIEAIPEAKRIFEREPNFDLGVEGLYHTVLKASEGRKLNKKHVFGRCPDTEQRQAFIEEVLESEGAFQEMTDPVVRSRKIREYIRKAFEERQGSSQQGMDILDMDDNLKRCTMELDNLCNALNGCFIPPGESGMPDENGRNILPTGRNFFAAEFDKIPTPAAYARGRELADLLLENYVKEEGKLPEKVAMNMISLDISRSKGEQLSQILYLMGIEPEWDLKNRVRELRVIPAHDLGRPRIDVTVRITGVLRDSWPDAVALIDEAVMMAANLDENDDVNFVRKHMHSIKKASGEISDDSRTGTIRIFGDPPGTYGAGVDLALKASAWEKEEDLMKYFIQHSSFAYGKDLQGEKKVREFVENVKDIDLSYDVTSSRRQDVTDCGFGSQVQGGLRLVAKYVGHKNIRQYQGMSENGKKVRMGTLAQRYAEAVQTSLLNELWKENMMEQGYLGAADMMSKMQNLFMDQCVNKNLDDGMLDKVVETYINDPIMQEWFQKNNSFAYEESARRFLELRQRGLWNGDENVFEALQNSYLRIEGDMEGGLAGLGEVQGGSVEIINDQKVDTWKKQLEEIDRVITS